MAKHKIFIDGASGTTGLQLYERITAYPELEIIHIDDALRKDAGAKREALRNAELAVLCLPDSAARDFFAEFGNSDLRILDTSTAHRVTDGWVYGFPELNADQAALIKAARLVANPGCHATGAIALLAPLTEAGLIPEDYPIAITSVTGYTGGGKSMIAEYEASDRGKRPDLNAPRAYALGGTHKHLPEITKYAGLKNIPSLVPIAADYPQGMHVIIPLHLPGHRRRIYDILRERYKHCKNFSVSDSFDAYEASNVNAGSDRIILRTAGNDDITILTAQFDNLGKGAAGAAIQNICLMLGIEYEN
jgi:N-acetyl-gamma-glutamyl-phosphate reductase